MPDKTNKEGISFKCLQCGYPIHTKDTRLDCPNPDCGASLEVKVSNPQISVRLRRRKGEPRFKDKEIKRKGRKITK